MIKKFASIAVLFIIFLPGCIKENPLENEFNKISIINPPQQISAEAGIVFTASNLVNGTLGGSVILDTLYEGSSGPARIFAQIKFKARAFTGIHLVTMMVDNLSGTVSFNPPSVFEKPANLDMKIEGLVLDGMDENRISFVYICPNGLYEPVAFKEILVNTSKNVLELKDAEIKHFSRYGWSR